MQLRRVAKATIALTVLTGLGLLSPILLDKFRSHPDPHSAPALSREVRLNRLYVENHLVQMRRDPLYWSCDELAADRARFVRLFCGAEHVVEFNLEPGRGRALLSAHGLGSFTDSTSRPIGGSVTLSEAQRKRLRLLFSSNLAAVASDQDEWQMPEYIGALESCIDGKPLFAYRRATGDEKFEALLAQITDASEINLAGTQYIGCR
jgi:hypothetical protein